MKMKIPALFFIVSIAMASFASTHAFAKHPEPKLLQPYQKALMLNETLTVEPIEGHHFNLKAPTRCGEGMSFSDKSPQKVACQMTEPGKHKITVSVCDDAVTFCRIEKFDVKVTAPVGYEATQKRVRKSFKHEVKKGIDPLTGFIENDPERALKLAKADNKLLLIDFYGIWCPPCNVLDEHVFSQPEFKEAGKDFVLVKLDADSEISWEWKDRFHVGGYPTTVIANSSLIEIGRYVGSAPPGKFVKWMREQLALKDSPIQSVYQSVQKSPKKATAKELARVGIWLYERGEYEEAEKFLKRAKTRDAKKHLLLNQVRLAKKEDDKKGMIVAYQKLIRQFTNEIYAGWWIEALLGLDKKKADKLARAQIKRLKRWQKPSYESKAEEQGFFRPTLFEMEAWIWEGLEEKEKAKKAFAAAAEAYKAMVAKSPLKIPRGGNMGRSYSLYKSDQLKEAKALYQKLAEAYPDEFSFNFFYARTLQRLEEYKAAYPFAKKAVKMAYGDNWLRAITLQGKIEVALKKPKVAAKNLREALKKVKLPRSTQIRTHRYVKRLRDALAEAEKAI